MSTKGFILALVALIAVIAMIGSGIAYSFVHPYVEQTPQQEFVRSCQNNRGVPDVHTNDWKCIR